MPRVRHGHARSRRSTIPNRATLVRDAPRTRTTFRPEIQALRALAIAAVVVYHLMPERLRGGFVGVDIFFVISGYLITAHLVRDVAKGTRTPFAFWARRIRRLMPASLTVLVVTAIATMAVVPQQLWQQFLREVVSSTLYVENWHLASASVHYLSASAPPSPVQHFWTLSVEEQFYLVWPLILLAGWWLARRLRGTTQVASTVLVAAAVVWVASFAYAWLATSHDPAPAFFATTTRGWEFASGAILAAVAARARGDHLAWVPERWAAPARLASTWLGWALIALSLATFDANTLHPGPATLLPVIGTLLVVTGGFQRGRGSPGVLVAAAPVQYLGNISYSLYLWHWPLIVLAPYALGRTLGWQADVALVCASVGLAAASYRWVERPMLDRTPRVFATTRGAMLGLAVAMLVVVSIPAAGLAGASHGVAGDRNRLAVENANPDPCRGAPAVVDLEGCGALAPVDVIPAVSVAADDVVPIARTAPCLSSAGNSGDMGICHLRDGEGLRVGLVGDSHIHQLIPTALELGDDYDWSITEVHKAACPFSGASRSYASEAGRQACDDWNNNVRDWLAEQKFDLVITSQMQNVPWVAEPGKTERETAEAGLAESWDFVTGTGARLLVVKDNPRPTADVLPCLELAEGEEGDLGDACTVPESAGLQWDQQVGAAEMSDPASVVLVNLDDAYCWDGRCHAVAGGTIVYRDRDGHMTWTWARSLAPLIADRVPAGFLTAAD